MLSLSTKILKNKLAELLAWAVWTFVHMRTLLTFTTVLFYDTYICVVLSYHDTETTHLEQRLRDILPSSVHCAERIMETFHECFQCN